MNLNFLLKKRVARGSRTASRVLGNTAIIELMGLEKIHYRPSQKEYKIKFVNSPFSSEERLYTLDREGIVFWKLLKDTPTVEDIVDVFVKRKLMSKKDAKLKILKFTAKLMCNHFVEIAQNGPPKKKLGAKK